VETLQECVVQFARDARSLVDARSLADARVQAAIELARDTAHSQVMSGPQQRGDRRSQHAFEP
jgi:hypothetical protein